MSMSIERIRHTLQHSCYAVSPYTRPSRLYMSNFERYHELSQESTALSPEHARFVQAMNALFALQEAFNERMGWNLVPRVERMGLLTDTVVQSFALGHQSEYCAEVLHTATRIEADVQGFWEAELQGEERDSHRGVFLEAASSENEENDAQMAAEILEELTLEGGSPSREELTPEEDSNAPRTPSDVPRIL